MHFLGHHLSWQSTLWPTKMLHKHPKLWARNPPTTVFNRCSQPTPTSLLKTPSVENGGFCIAAPLEQSALSQRTALKIGAGVLSAAESGRSVLWAVAFLGGSDRFDTCSADLIKTSSQKQNQGFSLVHLSWEHDCTSSFGSLPLWWCRGRKSHAPPKTPWW